MGAPGSEGGSAVEFVEQLFQFIQHLLVHGGLLGLGHVQCAGGDLQCSHGQKVLFVGERVALLQSVDAFVDLLGGRADILLLIRVDGEGVCPSGKFYPDRSFSHGVRSGGGYAFSKARHRSISFTSSSIFSFVPSRSGSLVAAFAFRSTSLSCSSSLIRALSTSSSRLPSRVRASAASKAASVRRWAACCSCTRVRAALIRSSNPSMSLDKRPLWSVAKDSRRFRAALRLFPRRIVDHPRKTSPPWHGPSGSLPPPMPLPWPFFPGTGSNYTKPI